MRAYLPANIAADSTLILADTQDCTSFLQREANRESAEFSRDREGGLLPSAFSPKGSKFGAEDAYSVRRVFSIASVTHDEIFVTLARDETDAVSQVILSTPAAIPADTLQYFETYRHIFSNVDDRVFEIRHRSKDSEPRYLEKFFLA